VKFRSSTRWASGISVDTLQRQHGAQIPSHRDEGTDFSMRPPDHGTSKHFGGVSYPQRTDTLTLHLAIGEQLHFLKIDRVDFSLSEISRLAMPAQVQYAVAHPTQSLLYVASSNRTTSKADDVHRLSTVAVDEKTGTMRTVADTALPSRPIHLTIASDGSGLLVAYNLPGRVTWHAIDRMGAALPMTPQHEEPVTGAYPHQVRMLPSGRAAVVVVRGNHPMHGRTQEDPGALRFLSIDHGVLTNIDTVAPGSGHGFGPRHLDFHPRGRWAALSMERQNELQVFAVEESGFADRPTFVTTTLRSTAPRTASTDPDQLCSAIHFNARGDRLYLANRHDPSVYGPAGIPCERGGNNLAVYAFDESSGSARLLQHVATESVHVRTFSLDQSDGLLIAASILPALLRRDDLVERVPARLSFFRVADDGSLTLARLHDMPNDRPRQMFWSRLNGRL
jgi:6-phosphogluconolactonase (cycloisomerase 2 family)